ncbi:hypothetical protein [Microvirga sp. 2TAF3]|uniref:hypothetical protein n=1 Tax=Microvirga sp. 2TAF3 TaxID=3233014 RepID=UPI003F97906E
MNTTRRPNAYHVSTRAQRLDPRQESRFALALVLLMGLAMICVMATTTHALSNHGTQANLISVRQ